MKMIPFPVEMKGTYAEINIDENNHIFIEIYSIKYDKEIIQRDKERGIFEHTEIFSYIELLDKDDKNLDDNIYFLYKLILYKANPKINDAWLFNESINEYSEITFTNLNLLLKYLYENFNLSISDFVTIDKTNIP